MAQLVYDKTGRLLFTKEMKQEYTLLAPQMLPMHFDLLVRVFQEEVLKFILNFEHCEEFNLKHKILY